MSSPAPRPSRRGEFDLIAWARGRATAGGRTVVGIGDDCAVLDLSANRRTLITTDMLMEGRHFRFEDASPRQIGYKALAVNLSDIAAMAGTPIAAVAAVALPRSRAETLFEELFAGMMELADARGVNLVGGDTNAWDGPLVISLTILGEAKQPVLRSGAKAGDAVFVTGPLGGSLCGRHLRPVPRIAEALALASAVELRAMIDVSDGLSSDLRHILEESGGLGVILDSGAIPIHEDARRMSLSTGRPPLDHALNDGEDFELCFTVSAADAERLAHHPPDHVSVYRIGEITPEPGMLLRDGSGVYSELRRGGFDHLTT